MSKFEEEAEKALAEIQNAGAQGGQEQLPQEIASQIEYFKSIDPTFTESQEYKDLIASTSGQAPKAKTVTASTQEEEEFEEEEDEDDIFGFSKPTGKKEKIKIDFEIPEELEGLLKDKFNVEDPQEFFENAEKWKQEAEEKQKVEKEYTQILEDLGNMPQEIKDIVAAWANGDDFTQLFQEGKRLNYSEDFEKQSTDRLVQHYLPEEYEELQEDFDAGDISKEEYDKQLRLLSRTTKRLFNDEKKSIAAERERLERKEKENIQNFNQSAKQSLEALQESFPNFNKTELNKINSILVDGNIEELFFNENGTYNKDAAVKIAYALYGSKIVEGVKSKAERQGESKANMKIVDSSAKTLRKSKSTQGTEKADTKGIEHLTSMFKSDPYA